MAKSFLSLDERIRGLLKRVRGGLDINEALIELERLVEDERKRRRQTARLLRIAALTARFP